MGRRPGLKEFKELAEGCKGNVGRMAKTLGVYRQTIYKWCKADERYQDVIEEYRGRLLDECLQSARAVSVGIPKLKNGVIIGWIERPDVYMLKYLISTLGRKEGFGESLDLTSKGESIKPDPVVVEVIDNRDRVDRPEDKDD